ncbi:precorrin-3B synthase [Rhizobium sp. BK602]|uniref:precorrin-3B synthase n=1 Tax=Rhizobium sp. BK602 TaxID=2586986 RepID=UPI00161DF345|nr:precorrin-3B synthase [Rhizobium sp. BK602]MBB3610071.1 precorrin-3B synthase [Rhizobium sp. BK602]
MAAADRQMTEERNVPAQAAISAVGCAAQTSAMARGACPSLSAPMATGDGLLVRLRPTTPGLTIPQFRALADAAGRHGNGLIEITARGNLQLRGLTADSVPGLAADIDCAGIVPETGVTIEVPPLSGLDLLELANARDVAARLRRQIAELDPQPILAPKMTIIIDGGGRLTLDALSADIRLRAARAGDGSILWTLATGGTARTAKRVASLPAERAVSAIIDLLGMLAQRGPRARGRDLDAAELRQRFHISRSDGGDTDEQALSPVGIHRLPDTGLILGLRPRFGQIHANDMLRFLDIAEHRGANEIRTAPDHALLLLGLDEVSVGMLQSTAADLGFQTRADDPANHLQLCSGAGACASAFYATRAVASQAIDLAPELLDGSLAMHLSGCRKGCAHPGKAGLVLVGAPMGYGIVVNGSASDEPLAYIGKDELKSALARMGGLVRNNKAAGESAEECLTRLGTDAIVTALRQG